MSCPGCDDVVLCDSCLLRLDIKPVPAEQPTTCLFRKTIEWGRGLSEDDWTDKNEG